MLEKRGFQFLRKFGKVGPFCDLYGPVDINNKDSLDTSGSNETTQKVLALIVWLRRNFRNIFGGPKFPKFENLCFSSDLGKI